MKRHGILFVALLIWALVFSGCAHRGTTRTSSNPATAAAGTVAPATGEDFVQEPFDQEDTGFDEIEPLEPDPLMVWNKAVFHLNDTLYFGVIKPVSSAYKALVPALFRRGIRNFFHNLAGPKRMINCLIQGKGEAAEAEWVRVWMNTTIGVLGFGNPAGKYSHLNPPEEDLGQSLGTWGVPEGWYVIWPFLGPSTIRDTVGMFGDRFLDPSNYIDPAEDGIAVSVLGTVNSMSFNIGVYESLKEAAIDPYEAMRDAHLQYRRKQMKE